MKNSAIKEICNGIQEKLAARNPSKGQKKNSHALAIAYEELKKEYTPKQLELHEKFVEALEEAWAEEMNASCAESFKLGLRLGVESMEE